MADGQNGGEGGQEGGQGGGAGTGNDGKIVMTQAELNAKMAEHKRTLQREVSANKSKADAFDALQAQVSELLGSGLIDGVEDLAGFREKAAQTIDSMRSEKEQAELQHKKLNEKLKLESERANGFKTKYDEAQIARAIADEAGPKASSPGSLELIQMKLAAKSKVADDGSVSVTMDVIEDGKTVKKEMTVTEAVAVMESDVSKYAPLFKSTFNSGSGGQAIDGVRRAADGTLDFSNMTYEKYLEISNKNPQLLEQSLMRLR